MSRIIGIDVATCSTSDCERIIEAARICKEEGFLDFFQYGTPLEVVDLLVESGLMPPKKKWWQFMSR